MYKGKPLIIAHRPWWRHPIFPWGWYSLAHGDFACDVSMLFHADGGIKPGDGGGGIFEFAVASEGKNAFEDKDDGGGYIGTMIIPEDYDGYSAWVRIHDDE